MNHSDICRTQLREIMASRLTIVRETLHIGHLPDLAREIEAIHAHAPRQVAKPIIRTDQSLFVGRCPLIRALLRCDASWIEKSIVHLPSRQLLLQLLTCQELIHHGRHIYPWIFPRRKQQAIHLLPLMLSHKVKYCLNISFRFHDCKVSDSG